MMFCGFLGKICQKYRKLGYFWGVLAVCEVLGR